MNGLFYPTRVGECSVERLGGQLTCLPRHPTTYHTLGAWSGSEHGYVVEARGRCSMRTADRHIGLRDVRGQEGWCWSE